MLIVLVITGVAQWIMNICNNYITYHVVQDIRRMPWTGFRSYR